MKAIQGFLKRLRKREEGGQVSKKQFPLGRSFIASIVYTEQDDGHQISISTESTTESKVENEGLFIPHIASFSNRYITFICLEENEPWYCIHSMNDQN